MIRNRAPLRPYSTTMPRALWWPYGGVLFLMSEVPLYRDRIRSLVGKVTEHSRTLQLTFPVNFLRNKSNSIQKWPICEGFCGLTDSSSSSSLLSSLELSDTKVYEPEIRALLGTDSHRLIPGRAEKHVQVQGYLAHKKHPPPRNLQ